MEKPNPPDLRWLLRASRERPRYCGTAEHAKESASPHVSSPLGPEAGIAKKCYSTPDGALAAFFHMLFVAANVPIGHQRTLR